jgi:hypothetical protein
MMTQGTPLGNEIDKLIAENETLNKELEILAQMASPNTYCDNCKAKS